MELDTDVLRSAYLADLPTKDRHSLSFPVLWEKTRCPGAVVLHVKDEDHYGVDIIHAQNSTIGHDKHDYRITYNTDSEPESSQQLAVHIDQKQTTREVGNFTTDDREYFLDHMQQVYGEMSGGVDRCSRNIRKRRRKQQFIDLREYNELEVQRKSECPRQCAEAVGTTVERRTSGGKSTNENLTSDLSITQNESVMQISTKGKRLKYYDAETKNQPRFRFGHYIYEEKLQKNSGGNNITAASQCTATSTGSMQNCTKDKYQRKWYIPETALSSKKSQNTDNPLESLSRYCETISSRKGSDLSSLTDKLITSKYDAFVGMKEAPASTSHHRSTPNNHLAYGTHHSKSLELSSDSSSFHSSSGMNPNPPADSPYFMDSGTATSLSYSNMLYSYHNLMATRRRMMMDEWYYVQMQGESRSWHRPCQSKPPEPSQNNMKSVDNSRSRLFGISISRSCNTNCLISPDNGISNKENHPRKDLTCDTDPPVVMDDSGLGTFSNSSFETDTDIVSASTCNDDKPLRVDSPLYEDSSCEPKFNMERFISKPHIDEGTESLQNLRANSDFSDDMARRRKYILEAMHAEDRSFSPPTPHQLSAQCSPVGLQTTVDSPPKELPNYPPLVQGYQEQTSSTQMIDDPGVPPPPLKHYSGKYNSDRITTSLSMETDNLGIPKRAQTPCSMETDSFRVRSREQASRRMEKGILGTFQNKAINSEALSDFKAILDAFDRSPAKSEPFSQSHYPVLEAALGKKSSENNGCLKVVQSLPKKSPKLYTCKYCGKGGLMIKAIRRHNLRKHSCPVCQERFCLLELLHKHTKENACFPAPDSF